MRELFAAIILLVLGGCGTPSHDGITTDEAAAMTAAVAATQQKE